MVSLDLAFIVSTITLVAQIAVLFLLVYGYSLKRKLKFLQHGRVMASAVIIHAITIVFVMIPSIAIIGSIRSELPQLSFAVSLAHGALGAIAFALGLYLVAAWRFKSDVKGCFTRKRVMIVTIACWVIAISIGVIVYGVFYGYYFFS
jgi:uncharacterized membrane protein YozB (DUF420 family)